MSTLNIGFSETGNKLNPILGTSIKLAKKITPVKIKAQALCLTSSGRGNRAVSYGLLAQRGSVTPFQVALRLAGSRYALPRSLLMRRPEITGRVGETRGPLASIWPLMRKQAGKQEIDAKADGQNQYCREPPRVIRPCDQIDA